MPEDPAWRLPMARQRLNAITDQVEGKDRRRPRLMFTLVPEPPDNNHSFAEQRRTVEVRRRKDVLGVAVNGD
jgi:hypothetical protein